MNRHPSSNSTSKEKRRRRDPRSYARAALWIVLVFCAVQFWLVTVFLSPHDDGDLDESRTTRMAILSTSAHHHYGWFPQTSSKTTTTVHPRCLFLWKIWTDVNEDDPWLPSESKNATATPPFRYLPPINRSILPFSYPQDAILPTKAISPLSSFLETADSVPIVKRSRRDEVLWERYLPLQQSPRYRRDCPIPMAEWQTTSFPTCNSIHERFDLMTSSSASQLHLLGEGGWRYTFAHDQFPTVCLKLYTLDATFDFDITTYERQRVDALVSERLTKSQYVTNIYGYCGLTAVNERAGINLREYLVRHHQPQQTNRNTSQTQQEASDEGAGAGGMVLSTKLVYIQQVAHAVADVHSIDYPNDASVIHFDLAHYNLLLPRESDSSSSLLLDQDVKKNSHSLIGRIQLNDFNDAMLLRWNQTHRRHHGEKMACPVYYDDFPITNGYGFTPVEMSQEGHPPVTEKADIWGLGALMYTLLVGYHPYAPLTPRQLEQTMKAGLPPSIPSVYRENTSATVRTVIRLIEECMVLRPSDRPTAKYVVDQLTSSTLG